MVACPAATVAVRAGDAEGQAWQVRVGMASAQPAAVSAGQAAMAVRTGAGGGERCEHSQLQGTSGSQCR